MGTGKTTSQQNVTKKQQNYSNNIEAVAAAAGSGGGTFDRSAAEVCLISATEKVKFLDETIRRIKPGLQFVIIAVAGGELHILSRGHKVAIYDGEYASTIRRCIATGYKYRGEIMSVDGVVAECKIIGLGRSS